MILSIAEIQERMNMPNVCRLFQIVKGHAVGSATVLSQFGRPQQIVLLIPVSFSLLGWSPVVVPARTKGMKAFPLLVVASVDNSDIEGILQTASNKDILHG